MGLPGWVTDQRVVRDELGEGRRRPGRGHAGLTDGEAAELRDLRHGNRPLEQDDDVLRRPAAHPW